MRVTSKGQITIPQAIRERWGLLPHTEVQFVEEGGRVFLKNDNDQPSRGHEAVQRFQQA
jgi:AbrB family looped-hinge helix DNA binding protein